MRTDEEAAAKGDDLLVEPEMAGMLNGSSFSGGERDALFVQGPQGTRFENLSMVSGMAHPGDGRVCVKADFDRDGFLDVALVNANAPLLKLYRNRLGEQGLASPNGVALTLIGGSQQDSPNPELSPRNPYGARVVFHLGDRVLHRELRCGEGMGAQNSAILRLGLGEAQQVDAFDIHWPSGRVSEHGPIDAGERLTVSELEGILAREADRLRAPEEEPTSIGVEPSLSLDPQGHPLFTSRMGPESADSSALHLFVFMGSWCASCAKGVAPLRRLLSHFDAQELVTHGLTDHRGDWSQVEAFDQRWKPPYEISALSEAEVTELQELCQSRWIPYAVPTYFVTDSSGVVLRAAQSLPTLSELRALAGD